MSRIGIYIHIPFCANQCPFCAFSAVQYSGSLLNTYWEAIKKELVSHPQLTTLKGRRLHSLYLGGGTPSLLPPEKIQELLDFCRSFFGAADDMEISLEATPESLNGKKVRGFMRAGVNRLSIGAQSFSDEELKLLGRSHTAEQTRRAVLMAGEAGFTNISLDLIYALPGQSLNRWLCTVEAALTLSPQHISIYGLTLEEGTGFYEFQKDGRFSFPGEDEQSTLYSAARKMVLESGFEQYEISNYAKPKFQSRHNLLYWTDGEYLGLGASAHSHLNGGRFANAFDPQDYIQRISREGNAIAEAEHLSPEKKAREAVAFGLRRISGFNLKAILQQYQVELPPSFYRSLEDLQSRGLITVSRENLRLTPEGLLLADELATSVLS